MIKKGKEKGSQNKKAIQKNKKKKEGKRKGSEGRKDKSNIK